MNRFLVLALFILSTRSFGASKVVQLGLASNFSELSTVSFNPYGGYFRNGVHLALEQRSKELTEKDIRIELKEFDYGAEDLNVIKAVKDAAKAGVVAVMGYNYSSNALIAAPLHSKLKLSMLSPSASANRLGTFGKYIHLGSFNNEYMSRVLAKFASSELKAKRFVIIPAANCAYCTDLGAAFEKELVSLGGEVVKTVPVIQEDKSFDASISALKGLKFDAVFIPNQELTAARIILSLLEAGIKKPFLGADGWGNEGTEFFKVLKGKQFEGYSVTHWHPELKTKASRNFVRIYQNKFGRLPNDTSVLAYDFMNFFITAILNSSSLDRESLEASLASSKSFVGVTGRYKMAANKAPQKDILILKTLNGQFKIDRTFSLIGVAK